MYRWLLALLLCSCVGSQPADSPQDVGEPDPRGELFSDRDEDGLCDSTENEVGTDPRDGDSDHDGLPDLIELVYGFDPTEPLEPAADQIGMLEARRGGSLEFPVRATVEGDGQGLRGIFQSLPSIYADGRAAADFFVGASAVSADPVDGVRSINEESARFAAVLGKTRLGFILQFAYAAEELDPMSVECTRSYPFSYAVQSDDGHTRAERMYLLLVVPESAESEASHCLPRNCQ